MERGRITPTGYFLLYTGLIYAIVKIGQKKQEKKISDIDKMIMDDLDD